MTPFLTLFWPFSGLATYPPVYTLDMAPTWPEGPKRGPKMTLFWPFLSSQEAIVHGPGGPGEAPGGGGGPDLGPPPGGLGPRGGSRSGPPGGSGPQGPKTLEFLAIDLAGFLKWPKRVILGPYPPPGPLGPPWAPGAQNRPKIGLFHAK